MQIARTCSSGDRIILLVVPSLWPGYPCDGSRHGWDAPGLCPGGPSRWCAPRSRPNGRGRAVLCWTACAWSCYDRAWRRSRESAVPRCFRCRAARNVCAGRIPGPRRVACCQCCSCQSSKIGESSSTRWYNRTRKCDKRYCSTIPPHYQKNITKDLPAARPIAYQCHY